MILFWTVFIPALHFVTSLEIGNRVPGLTCVNDTDCSILMTEAAENELACFRSCTQNNLCNFISYEAENKECSLLLVYGSTDFTTVYIQNGLQQYQRTGIIPPKDCGDWFKVMRKSGVYKISTSGSKEINVVCDMVTDGGGWTVIQRRQDGSVDFYRDWNSYKDGFGNLNSEFWLGNENIHTILSSGNYTLRIDLEDFDGNTRFAKYSTFFVEPETNFYTLDVGGYTGNAGDSLTGMERNMHRGYRFTTKDSDNDIWGGNCAVSFKGAWWYNNCHGSNLNGLYLSGYHSSYADGVNWYQWRGYHYSLKSTTMMIRK